MAELNPYIYGADSIVVPVTQAVARDVAGSVMRRLLGAGQVEMAKAPLRCDGPGSFCEGHGAIGAFVTPIDRAFMLCPSCFFKLEQRRGSGNDTHE